MRAVKPSRKVGRQRIGYVSQQTAVASWTVDIDAREIDRLGNALLSIGVKARQEVFSRALNDVGSTFKTRTKRALQHWTGIKKQKTIAGRMKGIRAGGGRLSYILNVRAPWMAITVDDFGARQTRKMAGATHSAWGNANLERGAFIIHKYGGKVYHRTSSARFPIKTVWGPNIAKEMLRHSEDMLIIQNGVMREKFHPRLYHHLGRAVDKAKAVYHL